MAPNDATYAVRPTAEAVQAPARTAAVIIVHGIGGQLPFQTLTETADGLREASLRAGGTPSPMTARAVGVGDDRLQRMELTLGGGTSLRAVHVYEAYWAPITEGRVTLRDVIRFLFAAGIEGLQHSMRPFKRFLAQKYVAFPVPIRTPLFLLTALFVVMSLVVMNASIVGLAAMRAPLTPQPAWASRLLFRDVTAMLDLFVGAAILFGLSFVPSLAWHAWLASRKARLWRRTSASGAEPPIVPAATLLFGLPSLLAFVLLLTATVAAGVALPIIVYFYAHVVQTQSLPADVSILNRSFPGAAVDMWLQRASVGLQWLTVFVLGLVSVFGVIRIGRGLRGALRADRAFLLTLSVFLATAIVIGGGVYAGLRLFPQVAGGDLLGAADSGGLSLVWLLAIGVSLVARRFLVAYVGDVAAYIQPQELDRFNTLRNRLKDCVWATARAVYRSPEAYDEVVVVGHSLGSLIGYDVLNRLYREEELGTVPDVRARSKLFVTFGCPLDKTAFLFAIQGSNREGREALATSVQPLIGFPATRPRWVNVYSGWDIISGSLDFYDRPDLPKSDPTRIVNAADPEASVWLAAHNQYWHGELLFDTIHAHLVK